MKERSLFQHRPTALHVVGNGKSEAEILLYDEISWWGITAESFKRELDGLKGDTIHVRINSPGGNVFDGVTIYNALREHPAKIITHIDGLAASMASVVALAGDEVRMASNGFFMVHDPMTIAIGTAAELRKDADTLEKIGGSLQETYRARTGATNAEVRAWMEEETWFSAEEALEAGFIDSIIGEERDSELGAAALFDLSVFAHTPKELLRAGERHEPTERELERALRDAGLSRTAAKAMVAAYQPLRDVEAEPTGEQRDAAPSTVAAPTGRNVNLARYNLHR